MGVIEAEESVKPAPQQQEPSAAVTAKGSERIPRERLEQTSENDVIALESNDKKTRKMEADQFRALLHEQREPRAATMTVPVSNEQLAELAAQTAKPAAAPARKDMTTGELMANVDAAFADFGESEPAEPKPSKKQALIVADHRLDTRHASRIAPITKPPELAPVVAPAPRAPAVIEDTRSTSTFFLIGVLAVAIIAAITLVLLS